MTEISHHPLCDEAWRHNNWEEQPCGICIAIDKAYKQARQDSADDILKAPTKGGKGVWMLRANAVVAAKGMRPRRSQGDNDE